MMEIITFAMLIFFTFMLGRYSVSDPVEKISCSCGEVGMHDAEIVIGDGYCHEVYRCYPDSEFV